MAYNNVIDRATNSAIELPEEVAHDVVQDTQNKSVIMQLARTVRMSSKSYRQPVLDVLPNAYWVNGDTGLKQTSSAEWESVYLTAEPLAVLVVVPDEFFDDATIPIWSEVRPLVSDAFGKVIDNAALWGVGAPSSWSENIYTKAAAAGNYVEIGQNKGLVAGTAGSDLGTDVAAMGLQLESDGFLMNGLALQSGFRWRLLGARDTNGAPIFTQVAGENRYSLYNIPSVLSTNGAWNNEVKAIGGDWSKALFGVRQDMTATIHTDAIISDDSGNVVFNAMQQDSKIMRVVGRFGFAVANNVTALNTNKASRYPFSLLTDNDSVGS